MAVYTIRREIQEMKLAFSSFECNNSFHFYITVELVVIKVLLNPFKSMEHYYL